MIDDFSAGYRRMTMNVQSYNDGPVIQTGLHDFINYELVESNNSGVVMRLGLDASAHFRVGAESAVPTDVLALPDEMFETDGIQDVFIVTNPEIIGDYYG